MSDKDINKLTKEELISEIEKLYLKINDLRTSSQIQTLPEQILINYKDYISILEAETDAIFKGDSSGNFIYANKAAVDLTGYTKDDLFKIRFEELFPEGELKAQPLLYDEVFDGNIIIKKRNLIKKNGEMISVEMNTKSLRDDTLICIMRDITHKEQLQTALNESENRYKLATEAAEEGVWDWQTNSDVVFYSDQWKAQVGYLPHELENTFSTWKKLLHPDDKKRMIKEVEIYLENPKEHFIAEFRLRHKDGSFRWIKTKAAPVFNEKGEVIRLLGAHNDVTEEIKIKQHLIDSEKKYRSLFEALPYGGEVLNTKGFIQDISPGTTKLLGYEPEDLIGKHVSEIIDDKDFQVFKQKFPEVLNGKKEEAEICMLKKDGSKLNVIRAGQPVFNDKGEVYLVFTLSIDISKRKLIERELIGKNKEIELQNEDLKNSERKLLAMNEELTLAKEKAEESNRLKSAFLANMSHEIRTPMNGILGFSQLLLMPDITDDKVKDYTQIIMQSGKHLLNIINDIIDIAKIDAGQLQIHKTPVNINEVLRELYSFFHSFKTGKNKDDVELVLKIPNTDEESIILTDETRFRQIISNLLNNAIKFTDKGSVKFGYTIEANQIIFFIKDTGIGIPKEKFNLIFNRFMQASLNTEKLYGGTGLGLAISKACVSLLGGKIWLESVPCKGSKFYFSIPLHKTKQEKPKQDIQTEVNFNGQDILVVEDDQINFEYIQEVLSEYNLNLTHIETADDAIRQVKEKDFDLILMDIQLPGKDGNYAIKEIRKINSTVPIVAQSAYAFENEKQVSYDAGCNFYMTKPIQVEEFVNTIKNCF